MTEIDFEIESVQLTEPSRVLPITFGEALARLYKSKISEESSGGLVLQALSGDKSEID